MEAIILAGGLGTRLRPVLPSQPKSLAPINGVPFLEILIKYLSKNGITKATLCLGYRSEDIVKYFGTSYQGISIAYLVEEEPLGTGGAILNGLKHIESTEALVINGDTFVELPFNIIAERIANEKLPVIFVRDVQDTSRYGAIEVSGGQVRSFGEKLRSGPGFINTGAYILPKNFFKDSSTQRSFSFEEFLQSEIPNLQFEAVKLTGIFIDIGTPEDFSKAQELLRDN